MSIEDLACGGYRNPQDGIPPFRLGVICDMNTVQMHPPAVEAVAPSDRPCFGVVCPLRGTCLRYRAVDAASSDAPVQATCYMEGTYPDYQYAVSVEAVGEGEARLQ